MSDNQTESATELKKRLEELIKKRNSVAVSLRNIEKQLYSLEESYLEETSFHGNIVKGWDNFLTNQNVNGKTNNKNTPKLRDHDRNFSNSSVTFMKAIRDSNQD